MNLKREEVTYVGSQERDGLFGACFYRDTQSIPNHTLILSARPKARIWKASLDGKVVLTYKLKDLLNGVKITPIYGQRRSERPEEETPGDQNIPNIFKRIRVIKLVH
ncbi:Hermansky-Pudlak syndrome 5 protein isoform X3 [Oopsacas minuta]|uniref:Hermansky-Pudlak syndrome 5 protein isoform X3 n=1 Tax=Oopsacas minuta TaxID=111878 RepID=A0AAV7JB31_9METZ|nr:Hermansky-Pudlak syndrome 5 protein isoform X3 [Oopsacas minuta]